MSYTRDRGNSGKQWAWNPPTKKPKKIPKRIQQINAVWNHGAEDPKVSRAIRLGVQL